ncbi:craniofacial development protein 1 [Anoplophora glabripennis]|uniref:craniofacial development protein 1 n=1 Tax=Anoplophora glabripennis TaxID=217634 RepID=UPI0008740795|nr:craniofacial development protein 1 [Anoplophora glabripennis]
MNIDLPDDSDTSDEDYVPSTKEDVPSEVDSDGEPEESISDSENTEKRGQKRKKKTSKVKNKLKNTSRQSDASKSKDDEHKPEEKGDKKQNVDDIWADFMKDTGFRPKNSKTDTNLGSSSTRVNQANNSKTNDSSRNIEEKQSIQKPVEKVKITQVFEFAGEEVKVEKEVAANSAEARLLNKVPDTDPKTSRGRKGAGLSGISGVLSQLGKKPKISTLEKSKLDWDKYKKEENIEEELQTYNKGKDGFLDRQDFLQRADLRRFEIEKDIRTVERNKRFNSTL